MNTQQQQQSPDKAGRQPSCSAKPEIGVYVFVALVIIGLLIYRFVIRK